jgi:hypothetical protein
MLLDRLDPTFDLEDFVVAKKKRSYEAQRQYKRCKGKIAFTVLQYVRKRKNQYSTTYYFADNSRLVVHNNYTLSVYDSQGLQTISGVWGATR